MTTKYPNTDFPNKKLLKGRDTYQNLSTTNTTGNLPKVIGIFAFILFSIGLVISIVHPLHNTIFIPMAISVAVGMSISLVIMSGKEKIELDDALYFNPKEKAKTRLINLIKGTLFLFFFLPLFFWVSFVGGGSMVFGIFAGIISVIGFIGIISEIYKVIQLRKQSKKFGPSKLTILNSSSIYLGDTLRLQLHNNSLPRHLQYVDVMLRNVQEVWEKRKRKKKLRRYSYLLYEDIQKVNIEGSTISLYFTLPQQEVAPTNYTTTAPFYWELEISNKKENYYCLFYIEVKK